MAVGLFQLQKSMHRHCKNTKNVVVLLNVQEAEGVASIDCILIHSEMGSA